jgi:multidrug efflux pump subunit AcrA (membrane-fusion protein)
VVPLPGSRVRQIGLVQVAPTEAAKVYPPAPVLKALHLEEERTESDPRNVVGILKAVYVRDGQEVKEGDLLAEFSNLELEGRLTETRTRLRVAEASLSGVRSKLREVKDPKERLRNQGELVKLHGEVNVLKAHLQEL